MKAWSLRIVQNVSIGRLPIAGGLLLLAYCLGWSPLALSAQQTAPQPVTLQGIVLDATDSPIAGATVMATAARGGTASTTTDAGGEFTFQIFPDTYQLQISASGFNDRTQEIELAPGRPAELRLTLDVTPLRTAVTVTESTGYQTTESSSGTRTLTPLRDIPQSITVVTQELIADQGMLSMTDVVRYMPGITSIQGENNRDQLVIRGNSTSADFFLDGVRDDVQYYRDLYNLERVEALKGPNAMVFGRGGGGGVVNRITKEADFTALHQFTLTGGSFGEKRVTTDLNQPWGSRVAARFNGMFEDSGTFRDFGHLQRIGVNPTFTVTPTSQSKITFAYEHLGDHRHADRGIPSFQGLPAEVPVTQFYGDPDDSRVRAHVDLASITVQQRGSRWELRNRTLLGVYDRGYQNYVPGAVSADRTLVSLSAYNNATRRKNLFNQTDFTYHLSAWGIRHTFLGGAELGRQLTDNFRNTGFFQNSATTISLPYANPLLTTPATFHQIATDANNHLLTGVAASFVQDQIDLFRHVQIVAGARFDYFDLRYHDNRSGTNLRRVDDLVSPRAGIVYKPLVPLSIYGSYSISYLPSSGDQFSSLTTVTQQVQPEKFTNYELGTKWDANRSLSFTTAVYRLDRTNTRSIDPNNPAAIIQTGSTRNLGAELGVTGRITRAWSVAGGYAYQNSFISSATASALRGFKAGQVPHNMFSLWNNYEILPRLRAGLGIMHRSDMFVAVDNTVVLPAYTRVDAAVFYNVTERTRFQVNVENILNTAYYLNADGNTNISPGSPRLVRAALVAVF